MEHQVLQVGQRQHGAQSDNLTVLQHLRGAAYAAALHARAEGRHQLADDRAPHVAAYLQVAGARRVHGWRRRCRAHYALGAVLLNVGVNALVSNRDTGHSQHRPRNQCRQSQLFDRRQRAGRCWGLQRSVWGTNPWAARPPPEPGGYSY